MSIFFYIIVVCTVCFALSFACAYRHRASEEYLIPVAGISLIVGVFAFMLDIIATFANPDMNGYCKFNDSDAPVKVVVLQTRFMLQPALVQDIVMPGQAKNFNHAKFVGEYPVKNFFKAD